MKSNKTAKLLGAAFKIVVVIGILNRLPTESLGIKILGSAVNISETMIKISDNPIMMQMSIVGFFIKAVAIVLLVV